MTTGQEQGGRDGGLESARPAGLVLGAAAMVMMAFMALHPTAHAHDPAGFLEELTGIARVNALVHGVLIAASATMLLGFSGLSDRLGRQRMLARGGLIAYGFGVAGGCASALMNGFVVPWLLTEHEGESAAALEAVRPVLELCHTMHTATARVCVIGLSIAVLLWSVELLRRAGALRVIGAAGMICGALPLLGLASGHLHLDVHGFGAFIFIQGLWALAIAGQLFRRRI